MEDDRTGLEIFMKMLNDYAASPGTSLVREHENITQVLLEMVESAQRYIYAVGGRSRDGRVLAAIQRRVLLDEVRYVRIVTGSHIRHQLCDHLRLLMRTALEATEMGYLPEEHFGNFLVTPDTAFIAIPGSGAGVLDLALRIADPANRRLAWGPDTATPSEF